jgi:hypothetical protein
MTKEFILKVYVTVDSNDPAETIQFLAKRICNEMDDIDICIDRVRVYDPNLNLEQFLLPI